ncbi:MAG: endonuclease III [Methanoregulaceae archaeon]|jgi:endonuclease-3|nr:endonuclease III [Methanoregulaceae archaeon]MCU0628722.1 endonuclease III [Methanoregulaceae archaeon]
MDKKKARRIFSILAGRYPDRWARERYAVSPFEVLITTILSAQTTDKSVDAVRDDLFSRFPDPQSLAMADITEVEDIIHATGFFHMKAKHIIEASRSLVERFSGTVPDTMEDLLTIPGVGRKTANIVLYHAFGKNMGVAVDTHVFRLAGRLGFSESKNAEGIEKDLMHLFPEEDWGVLTDILISHGRAVCTARKPACSICPVSHLCRYYIEVTGREKQE